MSRIKNFRSFCINESEELYFRKHLGNNASEYGSRARDYYGLGDDPSVLGKTQSFFQRMENRFERAATSMQSRIEQNRASRPYGGPNTGFEVLFGAASLLPNILKKVFGPTKYDFKKSKKDEVPLDLIRHTNEDFIREELPSIRTEEDLAKNIERLYQRGGVRMGQEPVLDDIARNRANIYYQRINNPGSQIFRTNNPSNPNIAPVPNNQPVSQPNN